MRPVYMPFTHISEKVARGINDLLGPMILYQPGGLPLPLELNQLAEKGLIKIRNPVEIAKGDFLADLKRDYHVWANQQSKRAKIDTSAFMAASDPIPFFEESSIAHIRTEINRLRQGESLEPSKNPILVARLFLALAQEHDAKKIDLAKDLSLVADMEKSLLENLKGDSEEGINFSQVHENDIEDAGNYMTQKRIDSWSLLYLFDDKPVDLFVTASRAVVEQLCETSDDLIKIRSLAMLMQKKSDSNENCPKILQDFIVQLGRSDAPLRLLEKWDCKLNETDQFKSKREKWSVYFAPKMSPDVFWERYSDSIASAKINLTKKSDVLNTLIFHFDR